MQYSQLFEDLVLRAKVIHKQEETECVSPVCFLLAVCELCASQYRGLTDYDRLDYPELFEEERLRFVFEYAIRVKPSLIKMHLKSKSRGLLRKYDVDFLNTYSSQLELIAEKRGKKAVSADVGFLVALQALAPDDRLASSRCDKAFDANEILFSIDKRIYGYVMREMNIVNERLITKYQLAVDKHNWMPALKIGEPKELRLKFFKFIRCDVSTDRVTLVFPEFFGVVGEALKVTVVRYDGLYYIHDNECTLKRLFEKVNSPEKYSEVLQSIKSNLSFDGRRVIARFADARGLLRYLGILLLVANADLYYDRLDEPGLNSDCGVVLPSEESFEAFDFSELLKGLKQRVYCSFDENCGTKLTVGLPYSLNDENASFLIETFEDRSARLSDARKGEVGEIFDSFFFGNDSLEPYKDYINSVCEGFGVLFDGRNLYLPTNGNTPDEVFRALFKFMNVAVVLSEFGRIITP
ncbi:MAG: hypothetical protein J6S13_09775 [Clostridia bacterium]|nr:hypothetical protein [Clostridia bacterium]